MMVVVNDVLNFNKIVQIMSLQVNFKLLKSGLC